MKINTIKNIGAGLLMLVIAFCAGLFWNYIFGIGGVLIIIITLMILAVKTKNWYGWWIENENR